MNRSAGRGAILLILAVGLGFMILNWGDDHQLDPVIGDPLPTESALPTTDDGLTESTQIEPDPVEVVEEQTEQDLTTQARPNSDVVVLVANGTAINGLAASRTATLTNQGFDTRSPENTTALASSVIYYRPGFEPEAHVVKNALGTETPVQAMPETEPSYTNSTDDTLVNVVVLIGADDLASG